MIKDYTICVCLHFISLLKENKLIEMHGISNLEIKVTGCYTSLTYATSIHYTPHPLHTHARTHTH
jgi:hypothetical protein